MTEHNYLAIDLGAESGRGILTTLKDGRVTMRELHRFPNRPVRIGTTLYWDFPFLLGETLSAMKLAAQSGLRIEGLSVDTWGVDFGLLDRDGRLLSNPVHYRDARTDGIHAYSNPVMPTGEIFAATAYEPWQISSLFQLLSLQRDRSPLLEMAQSFLNMPDLLAYCLTGVRANEMSILNTSNLMDTQCRWATEIIRRFGLPESLFHNPIVAPATVLGPLADSVAEQTGLRAPVIATCGHDTSAALAAVPAQGDNWAFLSCGTWSIIGALTPQPVATPQCLELGFTNEYTIGGWYLARNILGLWLVQELKRKWDTQADPWDYVRMTAEAARAEGGLLLNAADASLMAPADMEQAQLALLARTGQNTPASRGQLVRCVLESLALEYNVRLDAIAKLTGRRPEALYMVGGGIKNTLLCQLTANACGMTVYAGADQCTALGNGLGQALATGALAGPDEIRKVMRASHELIEYRPQDPAVWQDRRRRYAEVQAR